MKKYKLVLLIALILFTALIVTSYALGSLLSAPAQSIIGTSPSDLPTEDISILTDRGNLLSAWFVAGQKEKGAVLLMHGVRSNRLQMLQRAHFLHQAGYNLLLFDFQAHGKSKGEQITFGFNESHDASAAFHYLKQRLPNEKIAVLGVSLGGASALLSPVIEQADALILEAVYSNLETAIANRLMIRFGSIGKRLTPLLSWQIEPRLGFSLQQLTPIERISKVKAPIFIIAGGKDKHTRIDESKHFFELAPEPKQLWILDNAKHVDFAKYKPEEYEHRLLTFLADYL